jgi:hypothetical protein
MSTSRLPAYRTIRGRCQGRSRIKLEVADKHLDRNVWMLLHEICRRHFHGGDSAAPGQDGIGAVEVAQGPDAQCFGGVAAANTGREYARRTAASQKSAPCKACHVGFPLTAPARWPVCAWAECYAPDPRWQRSCMLVRRREAPMRGPRIRASSGVVQGAGSPARHTLRASRHPCLRTRHRTTMPGEFAFHDKGIGRCRAAMAAARRPSAPALIVAAASVRKSATVAASAGRQIRPARRHQFSKAVHSRCRAAWSRGWRHAGVRLADPP